MLGETCLLVSPHGGAIELVDLAADLSATADTFCRMTGTLNGTTATISGGECRYVNSLRSGRLFDLVGSFSFVEGQPLSISLSGKVEEVGSVRQLVNGVFVERDGFPQAITGTVTVRYEVEFALQDAPPLGEPAFGDVACDFGKAD